MPRPLYLESALAELEGSLASLRLALALAVFLVFVVMAMQFESLLHPFVILLTVPLGAVGVGATLRHRRFRCSFVSSRHVVGHGAGNFVRIAAGVAPAFDEMFEDLFNSYGYAPGTVPWQRRFGFNDLYQQRARSRNHEAGNVQRI